MQLKSLNIYIVQLNSSSHFVADDGVKYTCAMAWSSTVITWSMLRYAHAYKISMTWEYSMSNIRWTMDYFLKMFKTGSMYGQVSLFRET